MQHADDDEVVFLREVTKVDRERQALAAAITIDTAAADTPTAALVTGKSSKKRPFPATAGDLDAADEDGDEDDEDEQQENFQERLVRVKAEKIKTESEERFEAEKAYELRMWPDAATAAATAPSGALRRANGATTRTSRGGSVGSGAIRVVAGRQAAEAPHAAAVVRVPFNVLVEAQYL